MTQQLKKTTGSKRRVFLLLTHFRYVKLGRIPPLLDTGGACTSKTTTKCVWLPVWQAQIGQVPFYVLPWGMMSRLFLMWPLWQSSSASVRRDIDGGGQGQWSCCWLCTVVPVGTDSPSFKNSFRPYWPSWAFICDLRVLMCILGQCFPIHKPDHLNLPFAVRPVTLPFIFDSCHWLVLASSQFPEIVDTDAAVT